MVAITLVCLLLASNNLIGFASSASSTVSASTASKTTVVTTSSPSSINTTKSSKAQNTTTIVESSSPIPSPTKTDKITTQATATATLQFATTTYVATTTQTAGTVATPEYTVTSTATPQPSTEVKIMYNVNITLKGKTWSGDYLNDSTSKYRDLVRVLKIEFKAKFNSSNFNLTHVTLASFHNRSRLVMAKIILQFGKPPENKPKDPVEELKETERIGSYEVEVEVKEHFPVNAEVTSWKTSEADCCDMCAGIGGQVRQTRDCTGDGCRHVMKLRYTKCSSTCKTKCSAGHRLISSSVLFVAALLSALSISRT